MRIAFIDHLPVGTGIIRFATKLASALAEIRDVTSVEYYTHWSNFENNKELFKESGKYKVSILKSTFPESTFATYVKKTANKAGISVRNKLKEELESIKGFDVIYFPSAHMSRYYNIEGKKFGTFHDFNWKYSFGSPNFSKSNVHDFSMAMPLWFENTVPIASTPFIRDEINKFYPLHKYPVEVIYLPNIGNEVVDGAAAMFDFKYILYPANICAHKNHLNLYHALYTLKKQDKLEGIKLVLTGAGTDHFAYSKLSASGIEQSDKNQCDVIGLGYVNNDTMDNLIRHAALNISSSIYEAGSGPAIDAWINKVPFIMSDIESHRDQLKFYDLECVLFDPFNSGDIAEKINFALNNSNTLIKMSENGYNALKKYSWKEAAGNYYKVFIKYANGN